MVKIKLLGAQRYVSPLVGEGVVVEKGQTVSVTEEAARALLAESTFDVLNNEHKMWEGVADDAEEEVFDGEGDGPSGEGEVPTGTPGRARRAKKAAA